MALQVNEKRKKNQNFRKLHARPVVPIHLGHSPWTDNVEIFKESVQQNYDGHLILGKTLGQRVSS
jgi:hypothetical protein